MIIDDKYIIDFFYKGNTINSNKVKLINNNEIDKDILDYLDNRFNDSSSYQETLNRIKYNIEVRPVCKVCNGPVKWISKDKYRLYCSCKCKNIDLYKDIKQKTINKYGSPFNRDKFKKTIIDRFGEGNWCNNEKRIQTFKSKTKEEKEIIQQNKEKTYIKKFQVKNPSQSKNIEEKKDIKRILSNNFKHLIIQDNSCHLSLDTKSIKYNDPTYNNREKSIDTCLVKYGVKNIFNLPKYKEKAHSKESLEKFKKTSSEKYGYDFPIQSPIIQEKIYLTKKKNNSFNISEPEEETYKILKRKYPDIIRQYKSELYPFVCDFYIPSLDLYIECNYHWTHGKKLFEGTDEDNIKLEKWKSKKTKYYDNAIYTWTDLDIRKYNIVKENNLNYLCIYSYKRFLNLNLEELKNKPLVVYI